MYSRFARAIAVIVALMPFAGAFGVGLGTYEVQSSLGQALRMTVQVTARPDEQIDPNCFRINPYSVAGDGLPQLTTAQLTLERRGAEQRLIVTSTRAIMDPIVRIAIDVGCETTLRREITLLLDPAPAVESLPQTPEARPAGVPIPPSPRATPAAADDASRSGTAPGAGSSRGAAQETRPAAPGVSSSPPPIRAQPGRVPSAPPAARRLEPIRPAPPAMPAATPARPTPPGMPAPTSARPPRELKAPDTQILRQAPLPRPAPQSSRDRLTISTTPLPLQSYGATLSPRLNLTTSLGDRSRQPPLSENALALLRQKQARLGAAPATEDLPSLEAELVVLQKRTQDMQRQLEAVNSQMAAMQRDPAKAAAASSTPATAPIVSIPLPVSTPAGAAPAPAMSPAAPATTALPAPGTAGGTAVVAIDAAAAATRVAAADPPYSIWKDDRMYVAVPLGLFILLLILGFALWLRRERDDARRAERWNMGPYSSTSVIPSPPPPRTVFGGGAFAPARTGGAFEKEAAADADIRGTSSHLAPYSSDQDARELGVSDLAQATEKASVFVTLGRPEQAIDVLRDHIDHEPKSSPMAWLMLLDLYRQTDRSEDFNEVAERFHLEFNAVTPEWSQSVAPLNDSGLVAFPYLIAAIRKQWPSTESRAFIEELLYDNRGGSRIGFSIPAFRDLLLLHSLIDEYIAASNAAGRTDPVTGNVMQPPRPPAPPQHLADIWDTASPNRPDYNVELPASRESAADHSTSLSRTPAADNAKSLSRVPVAGKTASPSRVPVANMDIAPLTFHVDPIDTTTPVVAKDLSPLDFDMGLLTEPGHLSVLEAGYPIMADAVVSRWGKPGLAAYLSNLIRSSADRGPGLSNEVLGELIMLHDVANELGEPEPTFSIS